MPFPLNSSTNHLPRRTLATYQKHPSRLCPVQGDLCTSVRSRQSGQETPALSRYQGRAQTAKRRDPQSIPNIFRQLLVLQWTRSHALYRQREAVFNSVVPWPVSLCDNEYANEGHWENPMAIGLSNTSHLWNQIKMVGGAPILYIFCMSLLSVSFFWSFIAIVSTKALVHDRSKI